MIEQRSSKGWTLAVAALLAGCSDPPPAPQKSEPKPPAPVVDTMHAFADGRYAVDSAKLGDARWTFPAVADFDPARSGTVFTAGFTASEPKAQSVTLHVRVERFPHSTGAGQANSCDFTSWGKTVRTSDWQQLVVAFYEDWIRAGSEVYPARSRRPAPHDCGPAKMWGTAVGTDRTSRERERRDWYAWVDAKSPSPVTYLAECTTSGRLGDPGAEPSDALEDLVRHIEIVAHRPKR